MILLISLIVVLVILVLMILRFVYPELIYSLRQASVEVEIGRAILDFDQNKPGASVRLNEAQIKDIRFETRRVDDEYIRARICNIKKLYHLSSPRKNDPHLARNGGGKPQLCIIELSNLLSNYSKNIVPDVEVKYPLLLAEEILTLIAREIQTKQKKEPKVSVETVQTWFEKNPMSIEQVLEVLSSTLYALSYRHKFQIHQEEKRLAEAQAE